MFRMEVIIPGGYAVCTFLQSEAEGGWSYKSFQIAFFSTSYVVPLLLICGLYITTLKRLWRGPGGKRVSAKSRRGKWRVTRMVIIVVVIFAVCWCPIQLVLLLKSLNCYPMAPGTLIIQITSHTLAYTNSCVNPILYGFFSENFRKSFRKIFGRLFSKNNPPAGSKISKRSTSDVRLPTDKTDILEMKPI